MLARLALPAEAWAGLQRRAHERGIVFLSTPFDDGSADLLDAPRTCRRSRSGRAS